VPSKVFLCFAALSLAWATLAGAAASHLLGGLDERSLRAFESAVDFQFYHGLALLVVPLLAERSHNPVPLWLAGGLLIAGTVLFCGSLYATTLGAPQWIGSAAPFGGVCFVAGWLVLAWGAWRLPPGGR
jgi:uncharacterized membrane protein YgdD (TMEM256/DUF423 family)